MKALMLNPVEGLTVQRTDIRTVTLILSAAVLTTVHREALGVSSLPATGLLSGETARVWFYYASTLALFGLVPWMVIRYAWKERLSDFGVCLGDWRFGSAAVALLLPVIAFAFLLPAAGMADMREFYPVDKGAMESLRSFLPHASGRVFLFYVGWEFIFRGFLLFGLRDSVGDCTAICVQTLPSALWHIGYPTGELYASIAAGLLFGWLALRTRSILWPFILHAAIGVITDLSITLSV